MSALPADSREERLAHQGIEVADATRGVIYATLMGTAIWSVIIGVWTWV
jgi:hypothetical protein